MSDPLSVGDAFTVGVSFDLLDGYLLGRGLLASPLDINRRNTRWWGKGFNAAEAVSQIKSGVDGRLGLASLALGFLLQAGGYVALMAGANVDTGTERAVLAVVLMTVVGLAVTLIVQRVRGNLVRRLTVDVARSDPDSTRLRTIPTGRRWLISAGLSGTRSRKSPKMDCLATSTTTRNGTSTSSAPHDDFRLSSRHQVAKNLPHRATGHHATPTGIGANSVSRY
jgi:hypothetical protein